MGRGRGRKRQRWGERISPRGSFSAADAAAGEETQNAHFAKGGGGENIVSSARGETTQATTIAKAKRKANVAPTAASARPKRKCALSATALSNLQLEEDRSYVERAVAKQFVSRIRRGSVSRYDPGTRRWTIRYDDGGAEVMDRQRGSRTRFEAVPSASW